MKLRRRLADRNIPEETRISNENELGQQLQGSMAAINQNSRPFCRLSQRRYNHARFCI